MSLLVMSLASFLLCGFWFVIIDLLLHSSLMEHLSFLVAWVGIIAFFAGPVLILEVVADWLAKKHSYRTNPASYHLLTDSLPLQD